MTKESRPLHALALLGLLGCSTLAPDYTRPPAPTPTAWPAGPAYTNAAPAQPAAADIPWREFFTQPQLRQVIELSLTNNRDLRVAALNIERARAQYQIQRSELLPSVNATAGGSLQRVPASLSAGGKAVTAERYDVGLGFSSYELDLWGRVGSLKARALEQFLATEQARRSAQISLVAEVANAYLTLAADRERLALSASTLAAQQASFDLIRRRFEAGSSSELDLRQAQTRVDAARVDIARFTGQVARDENALAVLVGSAVPAGLLPSDLGSAGTLPGVAAGLPSEVLQRRPDIQQAENMLKAANANIGAARAAFFPRIALTAGFGTASDDLSGLFQSGAETWSFIPQITLPIFTAGRNRANLKVAEADRDLALAYYEKAIQVAFREVADALAQRGTVGDQVAAQQALVDSTAAAHRLSEARYLGGVDSQLPVLDAQRSLYGAQQGLIALRLAEISNQLTLYKALGGG
jgi:multidrug efflux system outer membrane protein